ncbi:MAG TPA: hypothetical protein VKA00_06215 [Trueperaceae bacterium]|nr:hypothetical protein [Trueperaceae bacterium]
MNAHLSHTRRWAAAGPRLRWRIVLVALAFGACSLAAFAADPPSYYPHRTGLSWTYDSGETQQLAGPRTVDGQQVMVLTHYFNGVPVSEDYLQYGPDGVKTLGTAAGGKVTRYDPPLVVYPTAPLEPGMQWQSTTKLPDFDITLSAQVLAVRGVETPAGRFNALQIRQQTVTSNGAQTVMDLFFVPSVGVVRFVTQDGTTVDLIDKNF